MKSTHHNKHPPKDISDNEDGEDGECGQTGIKGFADLVPDPKCETRSAAVSLCYYLIEVRLRARVRRVRDAAGPGGEREEAWDEA
jgi:hypothetical protein